MSNEEWRAVVGFEGKYEVSNFGRVRSLDRVALKPRATKGKTQTISHRYKGKILCPAAADSGHQFVFLGRGKKEWIHRLVLKAFKGLPPIFMEGCHNDGDPTNNNNSNLRWDTRSNNIRDDFRIGVRKRGNTSHGTVPGNSYARRTAV